MFDSKDKEDLTKLIKKIGCVFATALMFAFPILLGVAIGMHCNYVILVFISAFVVAECIIFYIFLAYYTEAVE